MSIGARNRDAARRRHSILSVAFCLVVGGTGVAVFGQQVSKKQATLAPSRKPAPKAEKMPSRLSVIQQLAVPSEKPSRDFVLRAGSVAIQVPVTIDTYDSWDVEGDPSNDVAVIDIAGLAGLGTGNPATMSGIGWDVTIDSSTPGLGSWLSEAQMYFDDNIAPDLSGLFLSPGVGDDFSGIATYSSGGVLDLTDNGIPDIVLPDGLLRIELFEGFDDADDAIDAFYDAVSTLTIVVLDPSGGGACCDDATAACVNTDPATCAATAGQTHYAGEDCGSFTCPPPPADYLMNDTPVTTCTGTFADSGDTGGDYSASEYFVKTFTPDTSGLALEFDFTFFEVEGGNWDELWIYNGNSTAAPLIGMFDTANPPGVITSGAVDGTLTFEFESDSSVQKAGWVATISCVTPPTGGACCDAAGGCTDVADAAACGAGAYAGDGTTCASYTCPSPGDDCSNPIVVDFATDLPYTDTAQTTCGRGNNHSSTCLGSYDGGEEIVYELVVPADSCVNIVMTSDTSYTGMAVDGICPLGDPCLAEATSSSSDESLLALTLTAGTHYLMMDTWPAPNCINSFDLSITQCPSGGACCHGDATCDDVADSAACVASGDTYLGEGSSCTTSVCPPANDLCDDATKISAVPFADSGIDMPGATDDANVDPSCDSSFSCSTGPANNGVWYAYTPAESCEATIDQTGIDASTSVWTGADCNSLTQLTCSDPDPFSIGMSAGVEYLILVSNWSCSSEPSSAMDFTFDCVPLPKGACCEQDTGSCLCTEVSEVDCAGTYGGDDTSCTASPDPCDCNGNGTCDPGDLLPGVAEVFDAVGLPVDIPDNDAVGVTHVLTVPAGVTIADLNVDLQITHTWIGDLAVDLTSPLGTVVRLHDESGGSADDIIQTYDDEGTPPEGPGTLADFDSEDAAGDWTLHIADGAGGDTGTLDVWSLQFNALPPTSSDCNGNGVPDECEDDCDGNGVPDDCDVNTTDPDGDGMVADDCNVNGLPDVCDVPPLGTGPDCQGDGIPDECQLTSVYSRLVIVADGGFEAGSPSPSWTEASTNFGSPLCTVALCGTGTGTGPHGGDWWAWFGGVAAFEEGSVEQTVTIPGGATTLEFYYENTVGSGNGTDSVSALIDGNVVWTEIDGNAAYVTYALVSVDISAYGDGGSHLLRFESSITGAPTGSNFFIDDVEILEPTGPPANDCNLNGIPDECDAPVCGNDCLEGGEAGTTAEECDGTLDDACPSACYPAGHALACQCESCGDGFVNTGEDCDGGICCTAGCGFDPDFACRPSTGACDPAESCDGAGADCPADVTITSCIDGDGCCAPGCNANTDDDCSPVCGNDIVEGDEACDGSDDAACVDACNEDCTCPLAAIPTASTWGLIAMALLLLAGAKMYFGRRSRLATQ